MPEKGRLFTDSFNEVGNALDETFSMLDSLRRGKLSREQLRDWYEKRKQNLQRPLGRAYDTGSEVITRMMPRMGVSRRPSHRRRRPMLRAARKMRGAARDVRQAGRNAARRLSRNMRDGR